MIKQLFVLIALSCSVSVLAQNWHKDYNDALKQAKAEDKPIILVFSGSDWCAPCRKLEKDIWTSNEFVNFSLENYVLYKADFPRKKANQLSQVQLNQNKKLAERYNTKGYFPLVLVLDKSEQVLGTTGFKKISPNAYIENLNSFLQ